MTCEISLLFYVSCDQSYEISLTFIDPVFFLTHGCYSCRNTYSLASDRIRRVRNNLFLEFL